jgi:hypothetical protein
MRLSKNTGLKWFICPGAVSGRACRATGPEAVFSARPEVFRLPAVLSATRVESKGAQETQKHVVFLENFFDELQRKFQLGNGVNVADGGTPL